MTLAPALAAYSGGAAVRQHPAPGHSSLETMTQKDYRHPIAPSPELVRQWAAAHGTHYQDLATMCMCVATHAAQWGADQELEVCCADIRTVYGRTIADWLRSLRRSKPPSLKEQALALLQPGEPRLFNSEMQDTIRRALEQLPDAQ